MLMCGKVSPKNFVELTAAPLFCLFNNANTILSVFVVLPTDKELYAAIVRRRQNAAHERERRSVDI